MNALRTVSSLVLTTTLAVASLTLPVRAEELSKLLADGQSVQTNVLADQRGGTNQPLDANAIANVNGNSANWTVTGNNSFGSFGSAQGMINVLQNTGNNVAMQSQLVVNVNLQ
ncbi:MAG: hypothetical protein ACREEL_14320 [Stellaceae bacterium]